MRLLAIDASTWWGGAALLSAESGSTKLVAEVGLHIEDSHAAQLLPLVEGLLSYAGWAKSSLDGYAAVRGPGSFTGVRVALGLVSGLALSAGRRCVGVGTLHALAEAVGPSTCDRVPLLDAGRSEVYGARFDGRSSPPQILRSPWVGDAALALEPGIDVFIFGSGAGAQESRLREAGYTGPIGRAQSSVAAAAGRIALSQLAGDGSGSIDMKPLYVRPADAEVKFR